MPTETGTDAEIIDAGTLTNLPVDIPGWEWLRGEEELYGEESDLDERDEH